MIEVNEKNHNKIALLVLSFDGYDDLWDMCIKLFNKYWSDCTFDKYLMTNYKDFSDTSSANPFKPLKIGEDKSWSKNLMTALDLLDDYEYVFLFMDDGFLINNVDNNLVLKIFDSFKMADGKFLSYLNEPKPTSKYNRYFGEISKDSPYRVTATSAIWNIEFLRSFLLEEEDAWMFEKKGARRAEKFDSGFFSVHEDHFKYIHGIIKGLWLPESYRALNNLGFDLSETSRGIFSKNKILQMKLYTIIRNTIFFLTPFKFRKFLIRHK
tara:strand:+ start:3116 stop:3916 length:801 start_codon:yes stop_codon:yes gene_type:complete